MVSPPAGETLWTTRADGRVRLRIDPGCPQAPHTVHQMFLKAVDKYGSLRALGFKRRGSWEHITYSQYYLLARKAAKGFLKVSGPRGQPFPPQARLPVALGSHRPPPPSMITCKSWWTGKPGADLPKPWEGEQGLLGDRPQEGLRGLGGALMGMGGPIPCRLTWPVSLATARPGAGTQCGHPRFQLPRVVPLGSGHCVCRVSTGASQGLGVSAQGAERGPTLPLFPETLCRVAGGALPAGGGGGEGLSGAGLRGGVAICNCLTPSLGPRRGIVTGIYTTSSPEACQYIALDCRANVIVVDTQKQLEKILKVCGGGLRGLRLCVLGDFQLWAEPCLSATTPVRAQVTAPRPRGPGDMPRITPEAGGQAWARTLSHPAASCDLFRAGPLVGQGPVRGKGRLPRGGGGHSAHLWSQWGLP